MLTALVFAVSLIGCGDSGSQPPPDSTSNSTSVFDSSPATRERFGSLVARNIAPDTDANTLEEITDIINDFSLNLHRAIVSDASSENSISSGYNAAVAMTLAYAGMDGNTRAALGNTLGFDDIDASTLFPALNALAVALNSRSNEQLILHTANRVFVRERLTLQDAFLDIATGDFGAPVVEADFAGAADEVTRVVNAWVAEQTDGFISTIIDRFSPGTVFAILNTIFLDAGWENEYQSQGEHVFTGLDSSVSTINGFGGRSSLPLLRSDDLIALEIPYSGGDLAMLILMPNSLPDFESTLDASTLSDLVGLMSTRDIDFTAPSWDDDAEIDLFATLGQLGLPGNPWNFNRLADGGVMLDVYARQKTRIEVDENGTRAAAVTLVAGDESVAEPIVIDHPFLYMIRDRSSGLILFTGRVVSL